MDTNLIPLPIPRTVTHPRAVSSPPIRSASQLLLLSPLSIPLTHPPYFNPPSPPPPPPYLVPPSLAPYVDPYLSPFSFPCLTRYSPTHNRLSRAHQKRKPTHRLPAGAPLARLEMPPPPPVGSHIQAHQPPPLTCFRGRYAAWPAWKCEESLTSRHTNLLPSPDHRFACGRVGRPCCPSGGSINIPPSPPSPSPPPPPLLPPQRVPGRPGAVADPPRQQRAARNIGAPGGGLVPSLKGKGVGLGR